MLSSASVESTEYNYSIVFLFFHRAGEEIGLRDVARLMYLYAYIQEFLLLPSEETNKRRTGVSWLGGGGDTIQGRTIAYHTISWRN